MDRPVHVLAADDHLADRELLVEFLTSAGYEVEACRDGLEAWERLEESPHKFEVILLDRIMPGLDGMALLARIRKHEEFSAIPVILQTALDDPEEIREGIHEGAYYYVIKPYDREMLVSVVRTAAEDYARYCSLKSEVQRCSRAVSLLRQGEFQFQSVKEAIDLGTLLASSLPDPENAVIGITELLVNAVEHGNLGITYDEKTELTESGEWETEISRRVALPENQNKWVTVGYARYEDHVEISIRDDGPGFDWASYLEVEPDRVFDTHGRGIAIANLLSFSKLEFRGEGNEVVGTIELTDASGVASGDSQRESISG